jgi:WD40 repeat protein
VTPPNPYVGPRAFRAGETLYGRDSEAVDLLNLLLAERIVLLYAPSGAGKSSLVEAKLRPALAAEGLFVLPTLRVSERSASDSPDVGRNPYLGSLLGCLGQNDGPASAPDGGPAASLEGFLEQLEAEHAAQRSFFPVLVFDQFEEILNRDADAAAQAAREEFFLEVGKVLRKKNRWALFSMREDYIAGLDPYAERIPTHFRNTFRLDLLREAAALEAICNPVKAVAIEFDETAARHLVANLSRLTSSSERGVFQPGLFVEPVHLQVACRRLWDNLASSGRLQDGRIDVADVQGAGDEVDKALGRYFAESVERAAKASGLPERTLRFWIESRLIVNGTRGQARQGPAAGGPGDAEALAALQDVYLIRKERRRDAVWFELAHDRLIEPLLWDNAVWRELHLAELQRRSQAWVAGRQGSLLLEGAELREARRWARENPELLTSADRELLTESSHVRARRLRRTTAFVLLLFALFVFMVWGWRNDRELAVKQAGELAALAKVAAQAGEIERKEAELKRKRDEIALHKMVLAAQKARLEDQGDRAALIARQAYLQSTRTANLVAGSLVDEAAIYRTLRYSLSGDFFRHSFEEPEGVGAVAVHPRGEAIAWAVGDRVRVLERFSQSPPSTFDVVVPGCPKLPSDEVTSLAFGVGGAMLAIGSRSGCVQVCRYSELTSCKSFEAGKEPRLEFAQVEGDAARQMLVAASAKGVKTWRLSAGHWKAAAHAGMEGNVVAISTRPAGDRVAFASADGQLHAWSVDSGAAEAVASAEICAGPGQSSPAVAWSGGGELLAWAYPSRESNCATTLTILDRAAPETPAARWALPYSVRDLAFGRSDAELFVATASGDVFKLALDPNGGGPRVAARLTGHRGAVRQLRYVWKDDTDWLASAGEDALRLWMRPESPVPFAGPILDVEVAGPLGHSVRVRLADGSTQHCELGASGTMRCEPAAVAAAIPVVSALNLGRDATSVAEALVSGRDRVWAAGLTSTASDTADRLLVTGYETGRVVLWKVVGRSPLSLADPLELSTAGASEPAAVRALKFDLSAGFVLAGDERGQLRRLDMAAALAERVCATVLRNLSLEEWRDLQGSTGFESEYECTCPNLPPGAGGAAGTGCRSNN